MPFSLTHSSGTLVYKYMILNMSGQHIPHTPAIYYKFILNFSKLSITMLEGPVMSSFNFLQQISKTSDFETSRLCTKPVLYKEDYFQ